MDRVALLSAPALPPSTWNLALASSRTSWLFLGIFFVFCPQLLVFPGCWLLPHSVWDTQDKKETRGTHTCVSPWTSRLLVNCLFLSFIGLCFIYPVLIAYITTYSCIWRNREKYTYYIFPEMTVSLTCLCVYICSNTYNITFTVLIIFMCMVQGH